MTGSPDRTEDQYQTIEDQFQAEAPRVEVDPQTRVEEFTINGASLLEKVKHLLKQGNVRRIIVKNQEGKVLLEIPLTVGIIGGVVGITVFPFVTAIAAIGALVARLTLVIEKTT